MSYRQKEEVGYLSYEDAYGMTPSSTMGNNSNAQSPPPSFALQTSTPYFQDQAFRQSSLMRGVVGQQAHMYDVSSSWQQNYSSSSPGGFLGGVDNVNQTRRPFAAAEQSDWGPNSSFTSPSGGGILKRTEHQGDRDQTRRSQSFLHASGDPATSASTRPAQPPHTATMCLRATYLAVFALCVLWPALAIAGIVMMLSTNPHQEQVDTLLAAAATYDSTVLAKVQNSKAVASSTDGADVELFPSGFTFEYGADRKITSVILQSADQRVVVPETESLNTGKLRLTLSFQELRTFEIESPTITLSKPASRDAFCNMEYSSLCGTTTCCQNVDLQRYCLSEIRALVGPTVKAASVTYRSAVADKNCRIGLRCGTCAYQQPLTGVCFVVRWSEINGWYADSSSKKSCTYPFDAASQNYGNSDKGAIVQIRVDQDPYLTFQQLTKGSMTLAQDNAATVSNGRGLLLFSIVGIALLVCISLLSFFFNRNLFNKDSLQMAFFGGGGGGTNAKQQRRTDSTTAAHPSCHFPEGPRFNIPQPTPGIIHHPTDAVENQHNDQLRIHQHETATTNGPHHQLQMPSPSALTVQQQQPTTNWRNASPPPRSGYRRQQDWSGDDDEDL